MNIKRAIGIILILAGGIIGWTNTITGAVIGVSSSLSFLAVILFIAGLILFFEESLEEMAGKKGRVIHGVYFDKHALERMGDRKIFPVLAEDTIKNGEHYKLSHVYDEDRTSGGTDVYVMRNAADILPNGRLGERIIPINPERRRDYKNVIVITDRNKTVKTAYLRTDGELRSFFQRYIEKRKKKETA